MNVLSIPGYGGSGPGHWQTLWESAHPGLRRVEQKDWVNPRLDDWMDRLETAVAKSGPGTVLVAHSLGCLLVAHWAARTGLKAAGALLVAPTDHQSPAFPKQVSGFAPAPEVPLPFPSMVVASADDPYASLDFSSRCAATWGSRFFPAGNRGHLNAESGLKDWREGFALLQTLAAIPKPLEGRIAVVAGATRGAGRGIASMLGEAGATVYCTGRSVRGRPAPGKRGETIEETAEWVSLRGGKGIPVQTDHMRPEQVQALFTRVKAEQGRLDILVNDVWGGDDSVEFGKPFWELDPGKGLPMLENAVHTHLLTSRYGAPLLLETGGGLIVEITDGNTFTYRGNLYYDLVKTSVIRLAFGMAFELRRKGTAAVAVTPGFLRSEAMLDHFGVTEADWKAGAAKDPHFIASETPFFVGRAVASLAADPAVAAKSGRVFSSWDLAEEYGFDDIDGSRPHWGRHFRQAFGVPIKACDDGFYRYWDDESTEAVFPDWP